MFKTQDIKKISYFAGYLCGDGAFCSGRGKRKDRMALSTTDRDVAEWVNDNIATFNTDYTILNSNEKLGIIAKLPSYRTTFAAEHTDEMRRMGVVCLKAGRTIPDWVDMKHWLLGFLDSDGFFSLTKRKDRNRVGVKLGFTHPSASVLLSLQTFFSEQMFADAQLAKKGDENCLILCINKVDQVERILDWLYADPSDVVMHRKYQKYLEFKKSLAEVREEGSCYPSEFTNSPEYIRIVGSLSRNVFIVDGVEYHSAKEVANKYGVPNATVHRRCSQGDFGWGRRKKTEEELTASKKKAQDDIRDLFATWNK